MPVSMGDRQSAGQGAESARWPRLSRRQRLGIAVAVIVLHGGLIFAIIRAFGGIPALLERVSPDLAPTAYDVPLDPPQPLPKPPPQPATVPEGASAAQAKRAVAKAVVAPPSRLPAKVAIAARAASTGDSTQSGASASGAGTGGGGTGNGTGGSGSGDGGGGGGRTIAQKAIKTAGDIKSARDYPAVTRNARIGTSVIVALTVGTDGRVADCTIHKPSGDRQADAITCRLATERFRFRPALDQNGIPVESLFGWEQRWFAP
jgi:protein TonB